MQVFVRLVSKLLQKGNKNIKFRVITLVKCQGSRTVEIPQIRVPGR